MQDFYVSLPSNTRAEENYVRQNTSSKFRIRLPQEINLGNEDWEVAMVELQYPRSFYNVTDDGYTVQHVPLDQNELLIRFTTKDGAHARPKIPPGYYSDIEQLTAAIQTVLSEVQGGFYDGNKQKVSDDISFYYDRIVQKVIFGRAETNVGVGLVMISPLLQYILGFKRSYFFEDDFTAVAEYPPDMRAGVDSLFVYCDVVAPQIVGDRMEQLLRIVPVSGTHGEVVDRVFVAPHYIPVLNKRFSTIEISINTDQDKPFAFKFGKTVVKLHFRKHRALRL